jgi:hypothetical protein
VHLANANLKIDPSSARTLPYRLVSPAARKATPLTPSLYRAAGPGG